MPRTLDEAILELGSLNDRDRIVDCFFEHARGLFQFSAFFWLRGDTAYGRNAAGLGAPPGLVARLSLSAAEPGILSRARTTRKCFVGNPASSTEADERLFGSLGRAMPTPLVLPLVVRERVIGIFLGDAPSDDLRQRAQRAQRGPLELASEELVVLAEVAGDMLERVIIRRKASSRPPPPNDSLDSATHVPPFAKPAPLPVEAADFMKAPVGVEAPAQPRSTPTKTTKRRYVPIVIVGIVIAVATVGGIAFQWSRRSDVSGDGIAVAGEKVPGWPADVDAVALLDTARTVAGLGAGAELGAIRAESVIGGKIDFRKSSTSSSLTFEFLTPEREAEVRVDVEGVHRPTIQPRRTCGDTVCRKSVPVPKCSFARVFESVSRVGLARTDAATIEYAEGQGEGRTEPEWLVTILERGRVHLDAECKVFPGERLRPAALPLAKIPGAPKDVDPIGIVPLALEQSGMPPDAVLLEIDARGVAPNGLVDLSAPSSRIVYTFAAPVTKSARTWRQVTVGPDGIPVASDDNERRPMPVRFFRAVPPAPRCTFAQARAYLSLENPITTAPARIIFGPDPSTSDGSQWSIEMGGLTPRTVSDVECDVWVRLKSSKKTK